MTLTFTYAQGPLIADATRDVFVDAGNGADVGDPLTAVDTNGSSVTWGSPRPGLAQRQFYSWSDDRPGSVCYRFPSTGQISVDGTLEQNTFRWRRAAGTIHCRSAGNRFRGFHG